MNFRYWLDRIRRVRPDVSVPVETFGGWTLETTGLTKDSVVYSFGIGEDLAFELALIERFGLRVEAFDPTPRSWRWLEKQSLPPQLNTHALGIAGHDGEMALFPPVDPKHVSYSPVRRGYETDPETGFPVQRLAVHAKKLAHEHVDLVKLDVEGTEYAVIDDMLRGSFLPKQLLVEFHHRFPELGWRRTRRAVARLRRRGYRVTHVSADGNEVTFALKISRGG